MSDKSLQSLTRISSWNVHLPEGMQFLPSDLLEDGSLAKCWVRVLAENPTVEILRDSCEDWITRGELLDRSTRVAHAMYRRGLDEGDRIILSASASVGMIVHYVAALRLGLVVVPMNTAYTRAEVTHIVRDVKPSAAIVDSSERAQWIRDVAVDVASQSPFVGPGSNLPPPKGEPEIFFSEGKADYGLVNDLVLDRATTDSAALIAYTSGTTGKPKGAILSHGNLLASARSLNLAWRWTPEDRLTLALPLFHMHGLGVGINGTLCAGSSAVLLDRFDPGEVLEAIDSYSATLFFGVPTMYQRFLECGSLGPLSQLRLMVSGSAPLSSDVHKSIAERTGMVVLERYGTTESLINISNPYDADRIAGKVGYPLPGVEAAVSEENHEVLISGPTVFKGYLNDPDATSRAFSRGEGWFATGDVVDVDDSGCVAIVGRLKDLIISGGYNVYPKEVEEALRTHGSVKDVAVVGKASRNWGEEVVAFVVRSSEVSEEELIYYAGQTLANYKRPKSIVFVEHFPRNALGKVVYSELRRSLQ